MTSNTPLSKTPTSIHRADASASNSSASSGNSSAARRARGSYRRQLAASRPGEPATGVEARRIAAAILEVLAGVRTPAGAASVLGIALPRYYLWEQRAVQGLVRACEPRPKGRVVSPDRRLANLERELATARRELARHQALARTAQRALGLTPASDPPALARAGGKAKGNGQKTAAGARPRGRRRPTVRALRAARLLGAPDSSGVDSPIAVQSGHGPSVIGPHPADPTPVAEPARDGARPAGPRADTT